MQLTFKKESGLRIAYGVFGYGRGHATRTAAVLPDLMQRHQVLVLAGGDAYDQLAPQYPVVAIPTLGYAYGARGQHSAWLTARKNIWNVADLIWRGPGFQQVRAQLLDFRPDVVISDAEPYTHRVARHLRIPRIGFDHFGVLVYCRPRIALRDIIRSRRDVLLYRWLMGRPERIIVSSFYHARPRWSRVRVIAPLLRDEILRARPTRGDYLLVYFNKGQYQFLPHVEAALRACGLPARIYGTQRRGNDGNLTFRPPSNVPFVEDLAGCRAVVSTAGNQLVGEAVQLGKPMLVMPEACVEQRLNAAELERQGFGMRVDHATFCVADLARFLAQESVFVARIAASARNGRAEAVAAIEQFLGELSGGGPAASAVQSEAGAVR